MGQNESKELIPTKKELMDVQVWNKEINEWIRWMNINKWTKEHDEYIGWMSKWMNEWMNKWMNELG